MTTVLLPFVHAAESLLLQRGRLLALQDFRQPSTATIAYLDPSLGLASDLRPVLNVRQDLYEGTGRP